jgi:hypothetical protein
MGGLSARVQGLRPEERQGGTLHRACRATWERAEEDLPCGELHRPRHHSRVPYYFEYGEDNETLVVTDWIDISKTGKMLRLVNQNGKFSVNVTDWYDHPRFIFQNETDSAVTFWVKIGGNPGEEYSMNAQSKGPVVMSPEPNQDHDFEFYEGAKQICRGQGYKLNTGNKSVTLRKDTIGKFKLVVSPIGS